MSKDLFLMMREQEIQTDNFLPTKKEIQTNSKKFIDDLINKGETDKKELYSQALRLKEKGMVEEVLAISIGSSQVQETIRNALAMGADSGIFVETNELLEPLNIAKIISSIATREKFGLIILGKQAIDDDMNATGQMTAALLGWAQATFASKVEVKENKAIVSREVDGGIENIEVNLPAIISTDLRLNEPRYASLPNIMKAKKKPIQQVSIEDLNIKIENRLNILKVEEPNKRQSGVMLKTVDELVDKLKNEAKVI